MNIPWYVARMKASALAVDDLLQDVDEERAHHRPEPSAWSLVEIVNHLADEEVEDFRTRLASTLADPATPWPGIDPPAWVTERDYQARELAPSLDRFRDERRASLDWLKTLESPAWKNAYEHPLLGVITAADLLVSWHAHDLLHLRQIARRLFELGEVGGDGGTAGYAGPW